LADDLPGPEAQAVEAHVEACAGCQQALEQLTAALPAGWGPATLGQPSADFLRRLAKDPPATAAGAMLSPPLPRRAVPAAAPEAQPADAGGGTPFGRYRLLRPLGHGGMGTVYLAHDEQLERLVALKQPHLAGDGPLAERFLHEARTAASLHHPNICP